MYSKSFLYDIEILFYFLYKDGYIQYDAKTVLNPYLRHNTTEYEQ